MTATAFFIAHSETKQEQKANVAGSASMTVLRVAAINPEWISLTTKSRQI
jgi:hypothetical protein